MQGISHKSELPQRALVSEDMTCKELLYSQPKLVIAVAAVAGVLLMILVVTLVVTLRG
jgi:hypothetical protein